MRNTIPTSPRLKLKASRPSRPRTSGARFRRLLAEALEPRHLLTSVTVEVISWDSVSTEPSSFEQDPMAMDLATVTFMRTGSTVGDLYVAYALDGSGTHPANTFWFPEMVVSDSLLYGMPGPLVTACPTQTPIPCVIIPDGQSEVTFSVIPLWDGKYEADETAEIVLGYWESVSESDYTIHAQNDHASVSVQDYTQYVTIESNGSASEGGSNSFTIRRFNWEGHPIPLGVGYSVDGPANITYADHRITEIGTNTGSVTIPEDEDEAILTVIPEADCRDEENEIITVTLTPTLIDGGGPGGPGVDYWVSQSYPLANMTIIDGDSPPLVSISDWDDDEGTSPNPTLAEFTFTFKCASDPSKPGISDTGVQIWYSTQSGTALPGVDYFSVPLSSAQLGISDTSLPVTVPLIGIVADSLDEYDEQFYVNVDYAQGATVDDGQGVARILDDDSSPTININSVSVDEKTLQATFTVTLSAVTSKTVTATYATEDLTALQPSDYRQVPVTTITFNPGQTTKSITVKIEDDARVEGTESFRVRLDNLGDTVLPGTTVGIGTITDNDKPKPVPPSCNSCNAAAQPDLIDRGIGGVGSSFAPPGVSENPVRYSDGTVLASSTDIDAAVFDGIPWGITRNWTNGSGYAPANIVGNGMIITQHPHVLSFNDENEIAVVTNGTTARYFNLVNNVYKPQFFLQEELEHVAGEYILTDTSGAKIRFFDFSSGYPTAQRGQFKSYTDADGNQVNVTSHTTDGKTAKIQHTYDHPTLPSVTMTNELQYSYIATGDNTGLLAGVNYFMYSSPSSPQWPMQSVAYTYYGPSEDHGNLGDLKTVTVNRFFNGAGASETTYYRYYKPEEQNGYYQGLKYVIYPESYARLASSLTSPATPLTVADNAVAPFADHYFKYDQNRRVTGGKTQGAGCSVCSGGLGEYAYSYIDRTTQVGYVAGPNSWATKTIETLPDLNQKLVFTNASGQVMLDVFVESPGTPNEKKWATYYRYDTSGRVVLRAEPSAVSGYNEELSDLVGYDATYNIYSYLTNFSGLITDFAYYAVTDAQSGSAIGHLESVKVRMGDTDPTPSLQSRHTYEAQTISGSTVFLPSSLTVYENENGTGELTTTYAYSGFDRIESQTTTEPSHAQSTVVYDEQGRPVWTKDAAGYISYVEYSYWTPTVERTIADVDTTRTSDFVGLPPGWATPAGGGKHAVSETIADMLGRPVRTTGPNDHAIEFTYDDYDYKVTSQGNSPNVSYRHDRTHGNGYLETRTLSSVPSLSRTYFNDAGQQIYRDDYLASYLGTDPNYGVEGVDFLRTGMAYDQRGRLNRVERPDGTIFRTVYDGLGRPTSEWIGTNDTGWTNANGAPGMTRMKLYVYDNGGVGDGHLTGITDSLGRTTTLAYDYRGRVTTVTLPDPYLEQGNDIPVYQKSYDNLGRITTETDPMGKVTDYDYDIDESTHKSTLTVTLPDPDLSGNGQPRPVVVDTYDGRGLLVSHVDASERETKYKYDWAGRVTNVTQFNEDEPSNSPETVYEYDVAGHLVSIIDPLEHETTRVYDDWNRLVEVIGPDPDGEGSLEAPHTHYAYDSAGRLESITDPEGNVTTWYFDALGRVYQETNELGLSRYFEYDAAGRLDRRTDRLGRVIEFDYNTLDQVTEERWYEGAALVRTLTHEYDVAGQLRGASDPAATYDYVPDGLGRMKIETQTITGFSPAFDIEYTSNYNKAGNRDSLKAKLGNTPDFKNDYGYDNLQRLTSLVQWGVTGGNWVSQKRFEFAYNAAGQIDTLSRFASAGPYNLVASTFYKYDPLGRLESMIHTESAERPESGWGEESLAGYVFTYDDAGRIHSSSSMIDGLTDYAYDNTNQLTGADHDPNSQDDEAYAYDANGNRTGGDYGIGSNNRLTTDGTYNYEYDAEGNRVLRTLIATGNRTQYDYDHRNRLIEVIELPAVIDPNVASVSVWYQYPDPQPAGTNVGGGMWFHCPDESQPQLCHYVYYDVYANNVWEGNPVIVTSMGYDIEYSIGEFSCDPEPQAPCSATIYVQAVGYPETATTLSVTSYDWADLTYTSYGYDAQVTSAVEGSDIVLTIPTGETYVEYYVEDVTAYEGSDYDDPNNSVGANWVSLSSGLISFSTSVIQGSQGTRTFNIYVRVAGIPATERVLQAYIYDGYEMLQTVDYGYDVHNQLVRRTVDSDGPDGANEPSDTFFSWEDGQIVFQFDDAESAVPSHRYLFNPVAIDQILADENASNDVIWPLTDHLGTVRDLASWEAGDTTIATHRVFDSYGNLVDQEGTADTIFRYTGVLFDTATGLQYNRNRWYDPAVGRWISEDPIGFLGGDTNLQRYVGNSPTNFADPSGLTSVAAQAGVLAGEVGAAKAAQLVASGQVTVAAQNLQQALCNPKNTQGIQAALQRMSAAMSNLAARSQAVHDKARAFTDFADDVARTGAGTVNPALIAQVNTQVAQSTGVVNQAGTLVSHMTFVAQRISGPAQGFDSYGAFQRAMGHPGLGNVNHHIVEQRGANVVQFGARMIHNTQNCVPVPRDVNQKIADYYSRSNGITFTNGLTVREWLGRQSFQEQYEFGLKILYKVLAGEPLPQ